MQEQAKIHDEILNRLNRRLRTVYQCNSTFFQAESEQELLQSICEILVAGGELRLAWIGYCEHDAEKTVRPVARAGHGLDYLEQVKISWGEAETGQGPAGIAVRTGKACWVDDIRTDPRFSPWRVAALARGYASCIAVPLIASGKPQGALDLRGTLNLYSAECNAFDESAIEYYTGLATSVTYAVTALRGHLAEDLTSGVRALRASEERKRAQDALQAAQAELARGTRFTAMGQMAASIAHEINQPLAAIVLNGNAALRWLANTTPDFDEARAALKRIVNDGHRASEVIGSIRAMCKKDIQERASLDVNQLIREVLVLVHAELQSQRVSVHTELMEDLPQVLADRVQLQQVIMNLIMNAVEAMGSITNRARVLRVKSEVDVSHDVLMTVEDSGTGIDPKDINCIFDAFFTTKSHGLGMGLSICRSIVEAHNGRLWASPGVHHGSVFHVALPIGEHGAE
ncbi:MAG: GAF domain-containing protein [Deltaproteobacteria bacterium]|nr:MAG: GAF domain-containing protein [Deltaproteobacteria bacterium]